MGITWRHFFRKSVTLQYPERAVDAAAEEPHAAVHEVRGLHRLRPVRAGLPGQLHLDQGREAAGRRRRPIWAADGTPIKLDVKVFDIDMSLCCYCNLCTYPCPTNCIYMTPEFEFATAEPRPTTSTTSPRRTRSSSSRTPSRRPRAPAAPAAPAPGRRRRGPEAP